MDFRVYEKKILRGLLSEDKLEQLQEQLRDIASADDHKELANEVFQNAGRLSEYRRAYVNGVAGNEDLRISRNQIRMAFLNIIDALPDEIPIDGGNKPKRLMTEQRFKSFVFGILLGGKLLLFAFIILQFDTGSLMQGETLTIIGLLMPAFTTWIGAALADIIKRRNDLFPTGNDRKTVSKSMQRAAFFLLPLYFFILFILINRFTAGNMGNEPETNLKALVTWLTITESGFGIYVGQIVNSIFK